MARSKKPTVMQSALRGAAAGLIGGVALAAAHRTVLPRLPDRTKRNRDAWDKRVAAGARTVGVRLSPRTRTRVGIGTQIAATTLLGAAYGILNDHVEMNRAGRDLVDAGLVFAASLVAPELQPTRRRPKRLAKRARNETLQLITAPSLFGGIASLALKALS